MLWVGAGINKRKGRVRNYLYPLLLLLPLHPIPNYLFTLAKILNKLTTSTAT